MKIILLAVFISLIISFLNVNTSYSQISEGDPLFNYLNEIKQITSLKNNEKLILFFPSLGSCPGCLKIEEILKIIVKNNIKNIKIAAIVSCLRKKDLETFKNIYNWKHYVFKKDKSLILKYELTTTTLLIILDYSGKLLFKYNFDLQSKPNFNSLADEILSILRDK